MCIVNQTSWWFYFSYLLLSLICEVDSAYLSNKDKNNYRAGLFLLTLPTGWTWKSGQISAKVSTFILAICLWSWTKTSSFYSLVCDLPQKKITHVIVFCPLAKNLQLHKLIEGIIEGVCISWFSESGHGWVQKPMINLNLRIFDDLKCVTLQKKRDALLTDWNQIKAQCTFFEKSQI